MCDYDRNCIVVCLEEEDEMEEEDEGQTPPQKSGFIGPPKPMVTAKNIKPRKSAKQVEGAEALLAKLIKKGKRNCSIVHIPADLGKKTMLARVDTEIAKLTDESRLYILGECVHPGGTLSGMVPGHLAERLVVGSLISRLDYMPAAFLRTGFNEVKFYTWNIWKVSLGGSVRLASDAQSIRPRLYQDCIMGLRFRDGNEICCPLIRAR